MSTVGRWGFARPLDAMRAVAIVALVTAIFAVFLSALGVWLAVIASVMALASIRWSPLISGAAFMLNIVNTLFLSPVLIAADTVLATKGGAELSGLASSGPFYDTFAAFHCGLFAAGPMLWLLPRKADGANE